MQSLGEDLHADSRFVARTSALTKVTLRVRSASVIIDERVQSVYGACDIDLKVWVRQAKGEAKSA